MQSKVRDNFFIGLAMAIMVLLYYSSSQPYEDQSAIPLLERLLISEPLSNFFSGIQFTYAGKEISTAALGYAGFVEFFIRKGAHFGIYLLLGLFWFLGLKNKMNSLGLAAMISWLLAAGYAAFDEFNQMLTPDRTPLIQDILLDSVGALTGIALALIFQFFYQKKKKKTPYHF